jgi:hypothetical protein
MKATPPAIKCEQQLVHVVYAWPGHDTTQVAAIDPGPGAQLALHADVTAGAGQAIDANLLHRIHASDRLDLLMSASMHALVALHGCQDVIVIRAGPGKEHEL